MSQDELLPEELNDCQQALSALVPRASRIDRDRLMIRLGEQSAARGSLGWKWATAASLSLAVLMAVRPWFVPQAGAPEQVAQQRESAEPLTIQHEPSPPAAVEDPAPSSDSPAKAVPEIDEEGAWLLAVASGQYQSAGMLTVRPQPESLTASRAADATEASDALLERGLERAPMLRWRDRALRRDGFGPAAPPAL
ncbi:MAG: hypothetical protein DWQ37_04350 [Planctomycetota bacterium]|nr:MAG: hypothetical protein DWQ37_04350 [Planctomycetota bacterium]